MKTTEQTRRELFEAWSTENSGASLERDSRGGYLSFSSMQLWACFNAALDAVVIELPKPVKRAFHEYDMGYNEAIEHCETAIESTNLGLKIR